MYPQVVRYSERPELWDSIRDLGEYWEPNVWIIHQVRPG